MKSKIIAKDKFDLQDLIRAEIIENGNRCDLNHFDVSNIDDMDHLFARSFFNGDISKWNVSNVRRMHGMFAESHFDGDISMWDISNVEVMFAIFKNSYFSGDLTNWKPYGLKYMDDIFWKVKCPTPYWAKIKNIDEKNLAIRSYELENGIVKELNEILNINNGLNKKIKI